MRVNEVNLGNGLIRLNVEPTCGCERNVPTHVVDEIMRDIIRRKNSNPCDCGCRHNTMFNRPTVATQREPDGIDIHVDRPLRENFCSHHSWADALAKYRTLEHVAKDCNWPCKEPMKTVEKPCRPQATWNHTPKMFTQPRQIVDTFDDFDDFENLVLGHLLRRF